MKLSVLVRLVPVAALLLAGCESLPPGVPPKDDIVKNDPPAGELSPRKAENLLITALGLYTLREMPAILTASEVFEASPVSRSWFTRMTFWYTSGRTDSSIKRKDVFSIVHHLSTFVLRR